MIHPDVELWARAVKLQIDKLSPWDQTIYLDADTRIGGPVKPLFGILDDGWDMAIVPCLRQREGVFGHVGTEERLQTLAELGGDDLLALQGGVMAFQKSAAVHAFFEEWRREWSRWAEWDQAALMRALVRSPVRIHILPNQYNNNQGRIVRHYFTRARRAGLKYYASL